MDTSSREWAAVLESSLVPETWFFRNMEAFDALAAWVAGKWATMHPGAGLRILSLPCATGEEPFSIAMCLLEAGLRNFKVRAGDISENSLAAAREATYRRNSFRSGFDEARFGKYFESLSGGARRVSDEVQGLVEFHTMNLADPSAALPPSDVIFCRNALIYFTAETQRAAIERLGRALGDDGILFLGPVEPPVALQCGFATAGFPMAFACVKKTGDSKPLPAPEIRNSRHPARPRPVPKKPALPVRKVPTARAPASISVAVPPDDTLEAARALADAGKEESAAAMLDRMAAPADPDFFCLRGIVNGALGRPDLAEADYRKALYLDPNHPEALSHLSLLFELDGRAAAAAPLRRRLNKIPA
jgi:chemotaxis protein methyltransferase WspC